MTEAEKIIEAAAKELRDAGYNEGEIRQAFLDWVEESKYANWGGPQW
jgi:hypothetical protein